MFASRALTTIVYPNSGAVFVISFLGFPLYMTRQKQGLHLLAYNFTIKVPQKKMESRSNFELCTMERRCNSFESLKYLCKFLPNPSKHDLK